MRASSLPLVKVGCKRWQIASGTRKDVGSVENSSGSHNHSRGLAKLCGEFTYFVLTAVDFSVRRS